MSMAPPHKLVCVAAPYDLRLNRSKAVLLPKMSIYIFTLHQPTLQPSAAARPTCGSGSRICKTSYRCRLYVIIPSYQASSFATGRGSPYYLQCRPTSARITKAHRPLSLILGMRDIHSYPQARYFIPRLFSYASFSCDLSIAAV